MELRELEEIDIGITTVYFLYNRNILQGTITDIYPLKKRFLVSCQHFENQIEVSFDDAELDAETIQHKQMFIRFSTLHAIQNGDDLSNRRSKSLIANYTDSEEIKIPDRFSFKDKYIISFAPMVEFNFTGNESFAPEKSSIYKPIQTNKFASHLNAVLN